MSRTCTIFLLWIALSGQAARARQSQRTGLFKGNGVRVKEENRKNEKVSKIKVSIKLEKSLIYSYDFSELKDNSINRDEIKKSVESCTPYLYSSTKQIVQNEMTIYLHSQHGKVEDVRYTSETLFGEEYEKCLINGLHTHFVGDQP